MILGIVLKPLGSGRDALCSSTTRTHLQELRPTETLPLPSQVTPRFNRGEPITREYYDDWMSGNSNPAIGERAAVHGSFAHIFSLFAPPLPRRGFVYPSVCDVVAALLLFTLSSRPSYRTQPSPASGAQGEMQIFHTRSPTHPRCRLSPLFLRTYSRKAVPGDVGG